MSAAPAKTKSPAQSKKSAAPSKLSASVITSSPLASRPPKVLSPSKAPVPTATSPSPSQAPIAVAVMEEHIEQAVVELDQPTASLILPQINRRQILKVQLEMLTAAGMGLQDTVDLLSFAEMIADMDPEGVKMLKGGLEEEKRMLDQDLLTFTQDSGIKSMKVGIWCVVRKPNVYVAVSKDLLLKNGVTADVIEKSTTRKETMTIQVSRRKGDE